MAEQTETSPSQPWFVTLRPWLFCLMFLVFVEMGVRVYFDTTTCLHDQRFDNFANPAAEDVWVDQIARDKAFKIVMIGDSVAVGPKLLRRNETIARYLELKLQQEFAGREIHVWNLSLPGARSTDQLCIVLKALPAKPDLVIVSGNYITFSQDVSQLPLLHPWLATNLNGAPESIRPYLQKHNYKETVDSAVTNAFEKSFRTIGMRQAINALVFGEQPRVPFEDPNPILMTAVETGKRIGILQPRSWVGRAPLDNWRDKHALPITQNNFNGRFYPQILEALRKSGAPALTYLTPQNPEPVATYMPHETYLANRKAIAGFFHDPQTPFYDFSDSVPTDLFIDNDHMLPSGNERLAGLIAEKMIPMIRMKLDSKNRQASSRTPPPTR